MSDSEQSKPAGITLPERIYSDTVRLFEQDSVTFEDAISKDPRLAYEVFGLHLRDAILIGRTSIIAVGGGISIDKEMDGDEAFDAVAQTQLNILKPLGKESSEVVIRVMKDPSFWDLIRKRRTEPQLKKEVRFTVPALLGRED